MDFQKQYSECLEHKLHHVKEKRKCGATPMKVGDCDRLFSFCQKNNFENILEIGTGTGLSTYVLKSALPNSKIDTIEFHQVHIDLAKENLINWGVEIENINFICGEFPHIFPSPWFARKYDLILFDGYSPKSYFLEFYEKILKNGGILISSNSHLKLIDENYFPNLSDERKWQFLDEFDDTKVYLKIC